MDKPLRGPALSKAIQEYVKQFILENDLKGGDPLPSETHLVKDLGVGRSSVREAVKSLQSLGIVEVRHGDGLYLREYNMDPILETLSFSMRSDPVRFQELLRIRIWLETAVIREAVYKINQDEIAELESIMIQWQKRIDNGEEHLDLDKQFHVVLYASVNNRTLMKLFDVFWIAFEDLRQRTNPDDNPAITVPQHQGVLDAVKLRDPDLATQRLIEHFDHVTAQAERAVAALTIKTKAFSLNTNGTY